jgi:hypothetical protein
MIYIRGRDDNGYPKSETRRVFTPLEHGFRLIFRPVDLLMGTKFYPLGLWARFVPTISEPVKTREFFKLDPT